MNAQKLKQELIYIAGHELRNPMCALSLQNDIFKSILHTNSTQGNDRMLHMVETSEKQLRRMESMLDRLISLIDKNVEQNET
ncbi:MAG: hypothetical protein H0V66_00995 [Bdellovibrionales bacterium]|nr:hypothetical protein [Bdellovibrionales bacterium]